MPDGPIFRSDDDVAEAIAVQRLSAAESHGWQVMDSLPEKTRDKLFALLEAAPRD